MNCGTCGHEVPDTKFCMVCGAPTGAAPDPGTRENELSQPKPVPQKARVWPKVLIGAALVLLIGGGLATYWVVSTSNRVAQELVDQFEDYPAMGDEQDASTQAPDEEAFTGQTPSVATVLAGSEDYSWQYSNEFGYEVAGVLSVGQLTPIDQETPDVQIPDSDASAGQICDLEPGRDAVVPVEARLTNRSQEFSVGVAMKLGFGGRADPGAPSVEIAQMFSDDTECDAGTYGWDGGGWAVQWKEPAGPGQSVSSSAYLVLNDYFTPEYPSGNTDWLRTLEAGVLPATNDNTGDSFSVQGESTLPVGIALAGGSTTPAESPAPTENMYEVIAKAPLTVRDSPSSDGVSVGRVSPGDLIHIVCVAVGDPVEDNRGRMISNWDQIDYPVSGYVADAFVDTGGRRAPVPDC